jgi:outer membrane protein W
MIKHGKINRFWSIVCLSTMLVSNCAAQQTQLNVKLGYLFPSRETFRNSYDLTLFITAVEVPIFGEIGLDYFVSDKLAVAGSLRISRFSSPNISSLTGTQSSGFNISSFPLSFGVKYYLSREGALNPFLGASAQLVFARFSTEFSFTDNQANIIGTGNDGTNYWGYGGFANAGVDLQLSNKLSLGLEVRWEITNVGNVSDGGLGNLGGFIVLLNFGIKL